MSKRNNTNPENQAKSKKTEIVVDANGITYKRTRIGIEKEEIKNPDGSVTTKTNPVYKDTPENTVDNIKIFLNTNPKYAGKLKKNIYTNKSEFDDNQFTDELISCIANDVERGLGFYAPNKVESVLDEMLIDPRNQYHPVRDYLKDLVWDGTKRIETLFIDWFKADDTPLIRAYARKWMVAAVKRIFEPGCKFDNVILLQGSQGIGKSTFCERLSAGFGVADNIDIENAKEYVPVLNQSWICVMDELRGFTKKEQTTIKNFLSKTEDTVRLSYERLSNTYKRHCVFIGSTNNETFLNDYSQMTERRYWIVKCNITDRYYVYDNFTRDIVDQLWAEAYYLYKKNPDYCLDIEPELYDSFKEDQKQYKSFAEDPAYEFLKDILSRKYPKQEFLDDEFLRIVDRPSEYNRIYELDKIPVRFINNVLNSNKCLSSRSTAWIKTVMEELGWKKGTAWYKATDRNEMCWKRNTKTEQGVYRSNKIYD